MTALALKKGAAEFIDRASRLGIAEFERSAPTFAQVARISLAKKLLQQAGHMNDAE